MGATAAAVVEYVGAAFEGASTASAAEGAVYYEGAAGTVAGGAGTVAVDTSLYSAGTAAGAATGAGVGSSLLKEAGTAAAGGIASAAVSSALAPKRPGLPTPTAMPDPLAQQEARKRELINQVARRGRASTMLTDAAPAGGKLGG